MASAIAVYIAGKIGFSNLYIMTVVLFGTALAFANRIDYDRETPIVQRQKAGQIRKTEPMV